jgi:hypothetical protein
VLNPSHVPDFLLVLVVVVVVLLLLLLPRQIRPFGQCLLGIK